MPIIFKIEWQSPRIIANQLYLLVGNTAIKLVGYKRLCLCFLKPLMLSTYDIDGVGESVESFQSGYPYFMDMRTARSVVAFVLNPWCLV